MLRIVVWVRIVIVLMIVSEIAQADDLSVEKDIVYAQRNGVELKLDIARLRDSRGLAPAIVFIHGGGWRYGHRGLYLDEAQEAARRGYVAATVSYRLTDPDEAGRARNPFPAQIGDVKTALRWLRLHAIEYHIDPDRMGVMGKSAGGHLSLLAGTTDPSNGLEGQANKPDASSRVQAVVNHFGPTDMVSLYESSPKARELLVVLLSGTLAEQEAEYRRASPATYVGADDPPMLTIHGSDDKVVPVEQARQFDRAMQAAGADHTLMVIPGAGHGFKDEISMQADEASFAFFDEHLKP